MHWMKKEDFYGGRTGPLQCEVQRMRSCTEHCSVWFYQLIDYYYSQEEDDARKRMTEKGFLQWPDGATAV